MMWIKKKGPKLGDTRVRRKFLWFPKCLPVPGQDHEIYKWLERASWLQKYVAEEIHLTEGYGKEFIDCWKDQYWLDNSCR